MATEQYFILQDLKDFMAIPSTDTSKDTLLQIYVDGVNSAIRKEIGKDILAKDYIEKHKGTDSTKLILNHYPINSITAVEFIYQGNVYQSLDDYEYDTDEETGILHYDQGWLLQGNSSYMSERLIDFPRRHIRVTYNAGFTETPSDLKLVGLQFASDSYAMDGSQGGTLKSYGISDVKYEYKDDIKFSEAQQKVIDAYKEVRF